MLKKERIYYLDILKAISIFGVVFIHVIAIAGDSSIKGLLIANFGEIFKFAVPVFLMVSGALLLNREYESISYFLKRRLKRLILPYLLWIIFIIIAIVYSTDPSTYSNMATFIIQNLFNYPLIWYFWLMIGIYFIIPVINPFIRENPMESSKYIILIFIGASILYQLLSIFNLYTFIDFRFFLMPISFLCLGYFLANYEFKNPNIVFILSVIFYIITTSAKIIFCRSPELISLVISDATFGQVSFIDVGIVQIIQATCVFLIIKYLPFGLSYIKRFVTSVSRSSLGIYLVHVFVFLFVFYYIPVTGSGTNVFLTLLFGSILVFLISWIIVLITSRIPFIKQFSGYA